MSRSFMDCSLKFERSGPESGERCDATAFQGQFAKRWRTWIPGDGVGSSGFAGVFRTAVSSCPNAAALPELAWLSSGILNRQEGCEVPAGTEVPVDRCLTEVCSLRATWDCSRAITGATWVGDRDVSNRNDRQSSRQRDISIRR